MNLFKVYHSLTIIISFLFFVKSDNNHMTIIQNLSHRQHTVITLASKFPHQGISQNLPLSVYIKILRQATCRRLCAIIYNNEWADTYILDSICRTTVLSFIHSNALSYGRNRMGKPLANKKSVHFHVLYKKWKSPTFNIECRNFQCGRQI